MKYIFIISALLMATAASAETQPLSVRSGDHPTFSRLTIPISASQTWEARQYSDRVIVEILGYSGSFDITDVFIRMGNKRIAGLDTRAGILTLRINCPCDSTVFRSDRLLVIDIADKGTKMAGQPLGDQTLISSTRPISSSQPTHFLPPTLPWIGGGAPFGESSPRETTPQQNRLPASINPESNYKTLFDEIQKELVAKVSSAASIGLLSNSYEALLESTVTIEKGRKDKLVPPKKIAYGIINTSNNLRITNSMDQPNTRRVFPVDATTAGITCPDTDLVSIENWGQDTGFSGQIGPARNALMNARDQLDRDAVKSLAQLYIYFGFGAEALEVLEMDPTLSGTHPYIADIATILERGALDQQNTLSYFSDCASDIALWASLSFRKIPSGMLIDTNAALRALNKLPEHLRLIIAPALSEKLLEYGDAEAAAFTLRSIQRLPQPLAPNALLAQASLALNAGQSAEAFLENVIEANSSDSPAALVKLVETRLAADRPLSTQTATLVEAYAQELRGTEIGNQLRKIQILALSQSEQFQQAFDALDSLAPTLSPYDGIHLRQSIFEQLIKRGPDFIFLEKTFSHGDTILASFSNDSKLNLSSRLLDLGFAAKAQDILASIPESSIQKRHQILAARAAIALQQPFRAQAALIGIDGLDAQLLMGQAKELAGAYSEAADIFESSNAKEQAAMAAWLSDEWQDLASSDASALSKIVKMAQPYNDDSEVGPLERANQALDESSLARTIVQKLLNEEIMQISPSL